MLPRKSLKVETKIFAVWGIFLEVNLKKSSTLKFIMNINFLTSICIHRSIILIFIGRKKYAYRFFSNRKFFFPRFSIFISVRILVSATKLANIKIIWSKLETKEQSNKMLIYWFIPDHLVTPGTESLTRHIDLLDAVTHTHLWLANLAKHKPVSTFSFSHPQNFHLFFTDASISNTSAFLPLASMIRKDEIYDQVVGSLSGQVFQSSCHQFLGSRNIVDTHTKWPPIRPQSLNSWLASDDWVTSLNHSYTTCTDWWWPKQNRFTPFENVPCKNEIEARGKSSSLQSVLRRMVISVAWHRLRQGWVRGVGAPHRRLANLQVRGTFLIRIQNGHQSTYNP